jgi:uncharacterized membrane protein YozB (DUF420 family)
MSLSSLPALNASLNATSAILLTIGWWLIHSRRPGRINAHRRVMISACVTSTLFLISYVIYHAQIGSKPYPGTGAMRIVYFSILIPHVVLAATVVPLALITLTRGLRRDDARHRRIAKITLPIWWFVSVTG